MRPLLAFALLALLPAPVQGACTPGAPGAHPTRQYLLKAGTAFDTQTHLTWQRCSVGQRWQEGHGCAGAVQGVTLLQAQLLERDGWRLPTIEELKSLVAGNCTRPAINEEVFPGMDLASLYYWSSTSPREASLYYLNFETGTVSADGDEEPYSVRLVRSTP